MTLRPGGGASPADLYPSRTLAGCVANLLSRASALGLLLLLLPLAAATHGPPAESLGEDILAGGSLFVTIRHTHSIVSSSQFHETRDLGGGWNMSTQKSVSANYRSSDALGGLLAHNEVSGSYMHRGEGTRLIEASKTESAQTTWTHPKWGKETGTQLDKCSFEGGFHDEQLGSITATLVGTRELKVRANLGTRRELGECERESVSRSGTTSHQTYPFVGHVNSAFLTEYDAVRGVQEVTIPLSSARHSLMRTQTFEFPRDNDADAYRDFVMCMLPYVAPQGGSGTCTLISTMDIQIEPSGCGQTIRSYREHVDHLEKWMVIPQDAPEPWILEWSKELGRRITAIQSDARALQLVGCDVPSDRGAIRAYQQMLYDALLDAHERDGLTSEGFAVLVSIEREFQITGREGKPLPSPPGTAPRPATGTSVVIEVMSPVELRARDEEGRVSGHEDGALLTGIPGSRVEGEPEGHQRLWLPPGFYKIEVEELREGDFLLDIGWNASSANGTSALESMFGLSKAGRTTTFHVALDRVDANGTPVLDIYPLRRSTTVSTAFLEPWTEDERVPPAATPGGVPTHAPAGGAAPTPAPGAIGLLGSAWAAALLRRVRR